MRQKDLQSTIPVYFSREERSISLKQLNDGYELLTSENVLQLSGESRPDQRDGLLNMGSVEVRSFETRAQAEAFAQGVYLMRAKAGYGAFIDCDIEMTSDGHAALLVHDRGAEFKGITLEDMKHDNSFAEPSLSTEWDADQNKKLARAFEDNAASFENTSLVDFLSSQVAGNDNISTRTVKSLQSRLEEVPGARISMSEMDVQTIDETLELTDEEYDHETIHAQLMETIRESKLRSVTPPTLADLIDQMAMDLKKDNLTM